MTWQLIHADCIEAMQAMDEASVDAIVTDPPYGLEFMGKEWDSLRTVAADPSTVGGFQDGNGGNSYSRARVRYAVGAGQQEWHQAWATEALRVLKPGGHLLAFGGTRTYHRLACALEDAGFEIRDCLAWMYGSGFPKSLNLQGEHVGWGTALKPAYEPIVLARKPLTGTVAANVLEHGVGALNIDGTRIGTEERINPPMGGPENSYGGYGATATATATATAGRWPANVILDDEAAAMLDEQSGESRSTIGKPRQGQNGNGWGMTSTGAEYADLGGASRFFYTAKVSRAERNRGLEHMRPVFAPTMGDGIGGREHSPDDERAYAANSHPTVKPVDLMQWLCRLVTPPKGTVLDPFTGSGSTGIAALREGFNFVGIEREAEYVEIARARIIGDAPLFNSITEGEQHG